VRIKVEGDQQIEMAVALERGTERYFRQTREWGEVAVKMSVKLQFVAGFHHSCAAKDHDKL
jgi:hypothetical protein